MQPSQLQFNQGLSNTSMPLSQFFLYDLTQPLGQLFGTNQLLGNVQTTQSLSTSQLLPSQLVQQPRYAQIISLALHQ